MQLGYDSVHQNTLETTKYVGSRGGAGASFESAPGVPVIAPRYDDVLDPTIKMTLHKIPELRAASMPGHPLREVSEHPALHTLGRAMWAHAIKTTPELCNLHTDVGQVQVV